MEASIPLPDLSLDEFGLSSFESGCPPSSPAISDPGSAGVAENFGFTLVSEVPIRCTLNSAVYRAVAYGYEEDVALKISANKHRLFCEFENRCKLPDCQYIVKDYDIFETNKYAMIQMELCSSGDIQGKHFDEHVCWQMLHDIGCALEVIHRSGFIHLDVSPMNILISGSSFKLCDLGTLLEVGKFSPGCEGSGPYASPEVLAYPGTSGAPVDVSYPTDIFSLGVCALEVASGFYAPRGGDKRYEELRNGHMTLGGKDFQCDFSEPFLQLVNAMLSPNPDRRPSACVVVQASKWGLRHM